MRSVVWLILVFVGAVVAATVLGRNDALVSFFYGSTRLDMSLNLFLISLLALVFLLFSGLQAINALLSLPVRAREWRALKRERAAHSALREALAELLAARYARAQRAAERALLLQAEAEVLHDDLQFTALAQLIAANGLHRLQDRRGRDDRLQLALALAQSRKSTGPSVAEGALLLSAEWALDDRDATRAMRELQALPAGVGRRTQALRLRLQATRQLRQPLEALQTARLLAKHQAFSPMAAQSLLRSLAIEALNDAHDDQQLQQVWERLDNGVRRDAFVVARAARRAQALGNVALGRQWLQPLWEQIGRSEADERLQLAMALVDCAPGLGSDWLPRIEAALAQFGHEPALVAAAAMAFADRQLWGKARRPLEQTASAASLPATVRRQALRCLAGLAREEGHEDRAAAYDQRAAMID